MDCLIGNVEMDPALAAFALAIIRSASSDLQTLRHRAAIEMGKASEHAGRLRTVLQQIQHWRRVREDKALKILSLSSAIDMLYFYNITSL